MLDIVCWKWKPLKGFRTEFTAYHVNVLYDMVKRNTTIPFRFNCVTDDTEGINEDIRIIPLWDDCKDLKNPSKRHYKPSCYRRLKAFSKDIPFEDRIVSIDLDCVIVGNIDDILNRTEDFICLKGTARKTAYNGGLWSLKVGARPQVWEKFDPIQSPKITKKAGMVGSDQGWISYVLGKNEKTFSEKDGIYSFSDYFIKKGNTKLPKSARIVMFQGSKDPWNIEMQKKYAWIPINYRMDSEKPAEFSKKHIDCITFLWGPGPYNHIYVNRLFNMIDRHLSYPHRNICFTNMPEGIREGIEIKPLHNEWMKDNLKKAIQFDPDNGLKGRVLSFDLDNVILKSLDMYAEFTDEFCICEAVNRNREGKCGGNFLAFDAGYGAETIWKPLIENYAYYEEKTKGYERYLYDILVKNMKFWPKNTILSYKRHVKKNKVKNWDVVRMIWGHGAPQLADIKEKVIVDNWK